MYPPEPLSSDELERLRRWERTMQRFYALAIPGLLASAAAVVLWADAAWLRRSLFFLVLGVLAVATVLQLRERCPRCRARLRTTMLLRLPRRCHYCGVPFRPEEVV